MKKKDQNKGFTLVELIVVLVILAILAAILVPALLGYIDQAKSKQTVLNAKSALTAAQAEMSNIYASKSDAPSTISNTHRVNVLKMADIYDKNDNPTGTIKATVLKVGCKAYVDTTDKKQQHEAFTITYVEYKDDTGHLVFNGSSWDEAPASPAATNGETVYDISITAN